MIYKSTGPWHLDVTIHGVRYREAQDATDKRQAKELEKNRIAEIKLGKNASKTGREFARKPFREVVRVYLGKREPHVSERHQRSVRVAVGTREAVPGGTRHRRPDLRRVASQRHSHVAERLPTDFRYPFNPPIFNTLNRPNRVLGQPPLVAHPSFDQYFNPLAFSAPPPVPNDLGQLIQTFGNAGRAILHGPCSRNLDFSLFKEFRVTERARLQFRGEAST